MGAVWGSLPAIVPVLLVKRQEWPGEAEVTVDMGEREWANSWLHPRDPISQSTSLPSSALWSFGVFLSRLLGLSGLIMNAAARL